LPNTPNRPKPDAVSSRELKDGCAVPLEPLITKAMQRFWRVSRGLTMGAQGVVLRPDNAVLLVRHAYRPGWHFPGGGVEKNETVLSALTRELDEEAGIRLDAKPELFGIYCHAPVYPGDHIALFVARAWTQTRVPRPNKEIAEQGFFQADALPDGTHASTRTRLAEVLHSAPQAETW
jgi:8-oxo-dGTP pyrophosphatase MutT (NUDIX family)